MDPNFAKQKRLSASDHAGASSSTSAKVTNGDPYVKVFSFIKNILSLQTDTLFVSKCSFKTISIDDFRAHGCYSFTFEEVKKEEMRIIPKTCGLRINIC